MENWSLGNTSTNSGIFQCWMDFNELGEEISIRKFFLHAVGAIYILTSILNYFLQAAYFVRYGFRRRDKRYNMLLVIVSMFYTAF